MCIYIHILLTRDSLEIWRQTESESVEKGIPCKWKSKESHSIKGSIQDITIVNIYASNTGALPYIWQIVTDMEGEIDSNTIIVGDFNTPFTSMDKSFIEKINRETQVLMIH